MNKYLSKIVGAVASLALVIGVGVGIAGSNKAKAVFADNSSFNISLKGKSLANATTYQTDQTTTNYDGGDATATLKWSNLNPNSGQVKGNQSTQDNNFWIYNSVALPGNIRSITLSDISGTYSASKVYAVTSSVNALTTRSTASSTAGTDDDGDVTWSFTGTSGGYFAVFATNGFSSGTVTATAISITYAPSGVPQKANVVLSCSNITRDVSAGATNLSVTATSGGNPVADLPYTYEVSNETVATVSDAGVITPVAIGETELTISFAGNASYNEASITITVTITDATLSNSNLTFTEACGGSGTANDGVVWSVTSDADESTFDGARGIHYGTGSANVTYVQLSTNDFKGNIKHVVVNATDAQAKATISVTVGGTPYTCSGSSTVASSNASYEFRGNSRGQVVVRVDRGSSMKNAIYVKSVVVDFAKITLQSISLSGAYQTVFQQGDEFNHNNMVVTAHYSDLSTETVSSGITWTGYNMQNSGAQTVTVTYKGITTTYSITVNTATMYSITGSISNGSLSSDDDIRQNNPLNITINSNARYNRPASLTVTMGGNALTSGSGYTYNSSTGAFSIASVTGNVVISGDCTKAHGYWDNDPFTVAEAIEEIDSVGEVENAYVEGIISKISSFSSNSITYWISDDGTTTNQLEAFKGKGVDGANFTSIYGVERGARVIITGTLTLYNTTHQFNNGNQLVSYIAPTERVAIEAILDTGSSIKTIHAVEHKTTDVPNESIVFADENLENGERYTDPFNGGHFTITFAGGENDGKYYTDGAGIRTYAGGSFTIASTTETITSIKFSWDGSYKPADGSVVNGGEYKTSTNVWKGSAQSITFTRPSGAGHWRLKSLVVSYGTVESLSSVAIRFGATISQYEWNNIINNPNHPERAITDYGVMLMKATDLAAGSYTSVEDAFSKSANSTVLKNINKRAGGAEFADPYLEDGKYLFTVKVSFPENSTYYNDVIYAAPYIVSNGSYYFFDEMNTSVHDLATEYYDIGYEYLSDGALAILKA